MYKEMKKDATMTDHIFTFPPLSLVRSRSGVGVTNLFLQIIAGGCFFLFFSFYPTHVAAARLGLKVSDQPADQVPSYGARIMAVTPGGSADKAGLRPGDVITYLEGHKIWKGKDLASIVTSHPPGKELSLTVVRGGREQDITLTPGMSPDRAAEPSAGTVATGKHASGLTGDPCTRGWLGADLESSYENGGIRVKKVHVGMAAARAGLKAGDIIQTLNGNPVGLNVLLEYLKTTKPGDKVTLGIQYGERPKPVVAVMGTVPEDVCLLLLMHEGLNNGDLAKAKSLGTTLVRSYPDNASGHSNLAYIYKTEGNLDAAKESLKKAIDLEPATASHKSNLGLIYMDEGNFVEAERYYRLALEDNPMDQNTWSNLGTLYRKQDRLPEAIEAYQEALRVGPTPPWVLSGIALCLHKQGKLSEARTYLEQAVELAPNYPSPYFGLGDVYYSEENWEEARKWYKKGLKLNPNNQLAWRRVAHTYQVRYMFPEATEAYRKSLEIGPPNQEILIGLGHVLKAQQDYSGAKESYEKAIKLNPKNSAAYHCLGDLYLDQQEWKKAKDYFELAVKYDKTTVPSWMRLGHTYTQLSKHSLAIEAYQKALEVASPDHRRAFGTGIYYGLGWNLFQKKRYAEAEKALKEALQLNPNHPDALITLGTVLSKQKKMAQAQKYWKRAAELDPEGRTGQAARQNLARAGYAAALNGASGPIAGRPDGLKATVTVGDFQVKAATAGQVIGDGLREMLLTALHRSGYFIVLERMDIKGLAAEQALSRSSMARSDSALPEGQMDVANIMVYGAVTEFEAEAHGSGMQMGIPQVPFTMGGSQKEAHMAIDVRVVDVATGRLLVAQRIPGSATSSQGTFGASIPLGNISMPISFSMFRDTPMEQAIRDCVQKATFYIINNIPEQYYAHQ
jgi:tetratricopeptide (TPR) repeat protein